MMTYYFLDDWNDIRRQKDGVDKDFSEIIDILDLLEDINALNDKCMELEESVDYLNSIVEKSNSLIKKLDNEVWERHLEVQRIIFSHASEYERGSEEFKLLLDISGELGLTLSLMEAKDDVD